MRLLHSSGIDYTCMLHSSLKVECNETIFCEQSVFCKEYNRNDLSVLLNGIVYQNVGCLHTGRLIGNNIKLRQVTADSAFFDYQ